jgi:hypothetical protein
MISSLSDNGLNSSSKAPRRSNRGPSNIKVPATQENASEAKLKLFLEKGDGWIEITMPIITVSEANGGAKTAYKKNGKTCYKTEHWTEKLTRHRRQKGSVALLLRPHREGISMPCHITLTRYAPRKLDKFDNLPMSMKYILDAICEIITNDYTPGRADSHEGLSVAYDQVISKEYGVKVKIQCS